MSILLSVFSLTSSLFWKDVSIQDILPQRFKPDLSANEKNFEIFIYIHPLNAISRVNWSWRITEVQILSRL